MQRRFAVGAAGVGAGAVLQQQARGLSVPAACRVMQRRRAEPARCGVI